jgi:hypothetical protein
MRNFNWTAQSERAAELIADGRLTNRKIMAQLGVSKPTLWRWSKHPEFIDRVNSIVDEIREEALRLGIAVRERRIAALNDRHRRMSELIDARASDPAMADVPGGTTGLLVRVAKVIVRGGDSQVVETFAFDAALVRELRRHEKQMAQELGQWNQNPDVSAIRPERTMKPEIAAAALRAILSFETSDESRHGAGCAADDTIGAQLAPCWVGAPALS